MTHQFDNIRGDDEIVQISFVYHFKRHRTQLTETHLSDCTCKHFALW